MISARIHEHGAADIIRLDEISVPEPSSDQVRVHLKTAALNHLDIWVRKGIPDLHLPLILGCDGAGEIDSVGVDVNHFKSGDKVILQPLLFCGSCRECTAGRENFCAQMGILGETINGTNCEYIVVPEQNVILKPEKISFSAAAAFPLVGQTAYQMLVKRACIQPGENVLIWGAGSGVGHMAVQIAKVLGCNVIATAGTDEKCAFTSTLGADLVLNHHQDDVTAVVNKFCGKVDVVFEHVGAATWDTSLQVLNKGGRVVTCGATTGPNVSVDLRHLFFKQQSIMGSTMGDSDAFRQVCALVDEGKIIPRVDKTFSLKDIQSAHEYLEQSNQFGKVIIEI